MSWYVMEKPDIVFVTRKEARDYAGVLRIVGELSYDCRVRKIDLTCSPTCPRS
jgi:hypothetical protein